MGFADGVSAFVRKTEAKIETAHRKIALDAFTRVILRSPVDTGRFRGNWQVSIGSVPSGTLELDDKEGTVVIGKVQAEALNIKAGDSIYLVNNLPYAIPLELGHSNQAPGGMIRLAAPRAKWSGADGALKATSAEKADDVSLRTDFEPGIQRVGIASFWLGGRNVDPAVV